MASSEAKEYEESLRGLSEEELAEKVKELRRSSTRNRPRQDHIDDVVTELKGNRFPSTYYEEWVGGEKDQYDPSKPGSRLARDALWGRFKGDPDSKFKSKAEMERALDFVHENQNEITATIAAQILEGKRASAKAEGQYKARVKKETAREAKERLAREKEREERAEARKKRTQELKDQYPDPGPLDSQPPEKRGGKAKTVKEEPVQVKDGRLKRWFGRESFLASIKADLVGEGPLPLKQWWMGRGKDMKALPNIRIFGKLVLYIGRLVPMALVAMFWVGIFGFMSILGPNGAEEDLSTYFAHTAQAAVAGFTNVWIIGLNAILASVSALYGLLAASIVAIFGGFYSNIILPLAEGLNAVAPRVGVDGVDTYSFDPKAAADTARTQLAYVVPAIGSGCEGAKFLAPVGCGDFILSSTGSTLEDAVTTHPGPRGFTLGEVVGGVVTGGGNAVSWLWGATTQGASVLWDLITGGRS